MSVHDYAAEAAAAAEEARELELVERELYPTLRELLRERYLRPVRSESPRLPTKGSG